MFTYTEGKKFTKEQVQQLFLSVHWISGNYPERLYKALMNSSTVLTVWDNEKLVGLTRVLDESLSYNLGAKNISRVKKTFRLLLICCVSGSFLIWLVCMTVPDTVASVFTNDAALITYTEKSMRVYLAMLLIYGIQVACQYSFVALD